MFMKKNKFQAQKSKLDQNDIGYICACQFFFDNINEVEQFIIKKYQNNNDNNKVMIDQKTLKLNIVAIYNLLKQTNIAKDCLMLWQWKLDHNQIITCTLIGYDNNNRINLLAINLKNWLITDQLATIIAEEDRQEFIHPYNEVTYIHQAINSYLKTINHGFDVVIKTCVYLPFYDFSLNNPQNFKTLTGQAIFNAQIINLVCNYNFNINTNFFYSNNKTFLIAQIKTMFFKGKGLQAFRTLFENQTSDENYAKVEQQHVDVKIKDIDITKDTIIENYSFIKNSEPQPIFVASNLKSQDNNSTSITIALPKHCFDGFYDQTVKQLIKRFAKIKYIKTNQFILIPLTNFKKYIVNNRNENIFVDDNSAFNFFEIKLNSNQEVIIMQQMQDGKLVQYKKIDPNNLKLHFSKEINEANLIKNNRSFTKMDLLQR